MDFETVLRARENRTEDSKFAHKFEIEQIDWLINHVLKLEEENLDLVARYNNARESWHHFQAEYEKLIYENQNLEDDVKDNVHYREEAGVHLAECEALRAEVERLKHEVYSESELKAQLCEEI